MDILNYIYGALTAASLSIGVSIADAMVPNDLWYWIDLYLPF